MALRSNIVEIMRGDIDRLKKLHDECCNGQGTEKSYNWKKTLTEYGEYYHCSDFETLNACFEEAKRPPVEDAPEKNQPRQRKKYPSAVAGNENPARKPAERSGCLSAFLFFFASVSVVLLSMIVSGGVGGLIGFFGLAVLIGTGIRDCLRSESSSFCDPSSAFSEEDRRKAEDEAMEYAIYKHCSDKSGPFHY